MSVQRASIGWLPHPAAKWRTGSARAQNPSWWTGSRAFCPIVNTLFCVCSGKDMSGWTPQSRQGVAAQGLLGENLSFVSKKMCISTLVPNQKPAASSCFVNFIIWVPRVYEVVSL